MKNRAISFPFQKISFAQIFPPHKQQAIHFGQVIKISIIRQISSKYIQIPSLQFKHKKTILPIYGFLYFFQVVVCK